jgi:adenosylmethionine-8-amino-7-oxononanoate aminotransferase
MPFEKNFTTNGSVCDETVSKLVISWPEPRPLYHFEMKFQKKYHGNSTSGWEVTELSLNVSTENNTPFKNPNGK